MLRILIVDDDILTRKGIQILMPWEKHHMKITGEASNGKEALDFLEKNSVDLVLVDLDMPIMDGMTFIQTASALYPELSYVVLTVHTEFEYIQSVLRIGALDYIAKTHFDRENFDQILDRIYAAVMKKKNDALGAAGSDWKNSKILYPSIYALLTVEPDSDEHVFQFLELNQLSDSRNVFELFAGVWVFTDTDAAFSFPEYFPNTMLLCISDVSEMTYAQLGKLLRQYQKDQFFYDYQPLKTVNMKHAYELSETETIKSEQTLEQLKKEWLSLNWIHENDLFRQITFDLKTQKLKPSALYHLLLALEDVWNSSYSELTGEKITVPVIFHSWTEVEEWLIQLYEKANYFRFSSGYSDTIIRNILNTKNYIDAHYTEPIDTAEIARKAQMSYGYFSRCFHNIVGVSFSDYCIGLRMEHAKKLLNTTGKTVQEIAFQTGYKDEKYFSRLFKKATGKSPSEYRKTQSESNV
ncbi:MAG: helix-turn-helix domain-containing protein [Eubacteriales bacterium]|nr:helix-turn-helix domain-containing protein [Eubacteriales bacterium]